MKKVILLLLFIPVLLSGQVADNFETGTLSNWRQSVSGRWKADSAGSLSGKYSLHHIYDNPDAGNDQIGISITNLKPSLGTVKWSFKIRHGYDPSASNNWGIFLLSDSDPSLMIPGGAASGFVLAVNITGYDDTLRLWKMKKGVLTLVLNSGINWQNDVGANAVAEIIVERTGSGNWKIAVTVKGKNISSASGKDDELFTSGWFGVYYRYTSTRDRLLWLDDILVDGIFIEDHDPPAVTGCTVKSKNSVELKLNEDIAEECFSADNFSIRNSDSKAAVVNKLGNSSLCITFEKDFINKAENTLVIHSLCDRSGNCSENSTVTFTLVRADPGEVIISEIMADPTPAVSLPAKEYLEIFNRTGFEVDLKNWRLINTSSYSVFPSTIIKPLEQIILCQVQDTSSFQKYGRVTGLKSFPALTDGGRLLILSDSSGNMIHGVEYSSDWYGDILKKEGGWSLEMIDTDFPFAGGENWKATVSSSGGTPGSRNSVAGKNPDISFEGIINTFPVDSVTLDVTFSEPVMNLTSNARDITINGDHISSVESSDLLNREFILRPLNPFSGSVQYNLSLPGTVSDYANNKPAMNSYSFGLPERTDVGDLSFNEILFNPFPGDDDFIELYNLSKKVLDASDLKFVSISETGVQSASVALSETARCIMPGMYYTVTTGKESVIRRYFSARKENIFKVTQLPSMPDTKGHLVIFNKYLLKIDEMTYDEKMHYSLLSGYEGISLEKIRPSLLSAEKGNWHSASESSGWGTPGAPNSVFSEQEPGDETVVLSSSGITPDNDGNEDLLIIDLNLKGTGNVVSITVFDETGRYIRKLTDNLLAGNRASIVWDATGESGSLVNNGIYILLISVFDDTGKSEKWKRVCAVIR